MAKFESVKQFLHNLSVRIHNNGRNVVGADDNTNYPLHHDFEQVGDHWSTGDCPRCKLEIALGCRNDRAGGKTIEEHFKLRGWVSPVDRKKTLELIKFIVGEKAATGREQAYSDVMSLLQDNQ